MKLALGTVQFGLKYGINNTLGKPSLHDVCKVLECAASHNITLLDTAADYGDSEEILGKLIHKFPTLQVVTKLSKNQSPRTSLSVSVKKLNVETLYGVLFHDFNQFKDNPSYWNELSILKSENLVKKIGFSLYLPSQLEFLLQANVPFDLIQVPYNIFDQRFDTYFPELKKKGVEIHTRSVFMQGLVFSSPDKLSNYFAPIKSKLEKLIALSHSVGKTVSGLCLNFVNINSFIDKIIIGVDSADNLVENIKGLAVNVTDNELEVLSTLQEDDEKMILPYHWKF